MARPHALICKRAFTAWGVSYAPGDVVDAADWPADEALPNRLRSGDVAYETAPEPVEEEGDAALTEEDLDAMTKAELVAYAADALGLELSKDSTKAELVAAILAPPAE